MKSNQRIRYARSRPGKLDRLDDACWHVKSNHRQGVGFCPCVIEVKRNFGLRVFEREPLPNGSPLATTPNLILAPHIGGVTCESNIRVSTMIAAKVANSVRAT